MLSLDIPDPQDPGSVADWVELSVCYEADSISKSVVRSKVNGASGDEPSDDFLSSVWDELEEREKMYGNNPPFIVNGMDVSPNILWNENPEYLMCLILALTGNSVDPTPTGKLFERLSKEAVKNYLNGEAIVTSHPAQHSISAICTLTCEGFKQELPANYKDRGVDVIAWKPFADKRGNQVIILMQCAGGHNWVKKTGDVVERAWREKYMLIKCPPVKGFLTAAVISNKEIFEEVSMEAHLLLDRVRIYQYTKDVQLEGTLRNEILEWCNDRLQQILN